jgi:glycerophosphoryl diester phosphodiesterase
MTQTVLRIGHRGAAGYAPENTLLAIEKGISLGADYVEIDVQRTADGHLVVMHDKRVDRTTNGSGLVSKLTLEQISTLDAGAGEKVPTLSDVLQAVNGRVGLMLEIITPGIAPQVLATVQKSNLTSPLLYASFLHAEVLEINNLDPSARSVALLEGLPISGAQFACDARAAYAGLAFESITAAFLDAIHARNLKSMVYTLDDARDIASAVAMRVDAIVSNYPDRI